MNLLYFAALILLLLFLPEILRFLMFPYIWYTERKKSKRAGEILRKRAEELDKHEPWNGRD